MLNRGSLRANKTTKQPLTSLFKDLGACDYRPEKAQPKGA